MKLEATIVVDRPVADVWDFVAVHHVENHPRWDPDIQLEQVSEGPIGVGTLITRRNTRFGAPVEGSVQIVEFEPERSIRSLIRDGDRQMNGFITFAPEGDAQTRLTLGADIGWLDDAEVAAFIKSKMQRSVTTIKEFLESTE